MMKNTKRNDLPVLGILGLLFVILIVGVQQLLKTNSSQSAYQTALLHPLDKLSQQDQVKLSPTNDYAPVAIDSMGSLGPVDPLSLVPKQAVLPAVPTDPPSFVYAAKRIIPTVVHITAKRAPKTVRRGKNNLEDLLKEFFGEGFELGPKEYKTKPGEVFGSGVIISPDGLVVTNNHVVDGSDSLEITLEDNRRYTAKLVGVDFDTDLALLKIEEKNLPYAVLGDSDALQVGEWIITVGNPFGLDFTVTAGIVGAKGRSTDLSKTGSRVTIASFIQTDAAINAGNSGGALANLKGELVGVPTAISTPNGAFAGYGFAIPTSILKRVVADLAKYGMVQRAVLGVIPMDVNADLAAEKKLKRFDGVYINKFTERSAAQEAGLREGDVIIGINSSKIKNLPQLQETLAAYNPGDEIQVMVDRSGKQMTIPVRLGNATNKIKIIRGQHDVEIEGATFEPIDSALQQKLGISQGVQITKIKSGKFKEAGIRQGLVVLSIDKEKVESLDQLITTLNSKKGGIFVVGIYPGTEQKAYYGLPWGDL